MHDTTGLFRVIPMRILLLTMLAMIAFAGNSLLCRLALKHTGIHPAAFTLLRLVSGALLLGLVIAGRRKSKERRGSWISGLALFLYAACFSLAYVSLPAAAGTLLLFGAVQATMIGRGWWKGERQQGRQYLGLLMALVGLIALLLPGLSAPPLLGSLLMIGAGVSWGVYSLRGMGELDPISATAGNFLRAAPFGLALGWLCAPRIMMWPATGVLYALASGALTSGLGYAVWYAVLPSLRATAAATVQLSVPVLAALGGILWLHEPLTLRLVVCSFAVLGGIALILLGKPQQN